MRYYQRGETLVIRGSFRAASSAGEGGLGQVSTLMNYAATPGEDLKDPCRLIRNKIAAEGLPKDAFWMVTPVDSGFICILKYDYITAFISAGKEAGHPEDPGITNIVVCSDEGFTDGALLGAIVTITEAKVLALREAGYLAPGLGDAVIVASEGEAVHASAGGATGPGEKIRAAIRFGISETVKRSSGGAIRDSPLFFIFSRFKGSHWVEWKPDQCPYYPCHFTDQACDFCYCPYYPCFDESLGQWMESSSHQSQVWNCADCRLLHEPDVAAYLKEHPMASLRELKSYKKMSLNKGM